MKHLLVHGATQTLQGLQGVDARVRAVLTPHPNGPILPSKPTVLSIDSEKRRDTFSKMVFSLETLQAKAMKIQGFSYLSEVGARGLLNLVEKTSGPSKLGKLELDCLFKRIIII